MEIDSYVVPSRSSVRKAGKVLVSTAGNEDKSDALMTLSNWRAVHAVPINTLQAFLRKKVEDLKFSLLLLLRD